MAVKAGRKHLMRVAVPRAWPTLRKKRRQKYITKTSAGAHKKELSIAVITILKEMLKLADNSSEVKKILKEGKVAVNGKKVKNPKLAVGFMDVLTIIPLGKHYRMLLSANGRLELNEIPEQNSKFILSKVMGKTVLKKGKMQLNFEDGRNQIVEKDTFRTGDVVKIQVPEQKILEHYEMKPGNTAYITNGKHAGKVGTIEKTIPGSAEAKPKVRIKAREGEFETLKDYVFVIGKEKPVISIGGHK